MSNTTYDLGRVGMNVRGEYSPAIASAVDSISGLK